MTNVQMMKITDGKEAQSRCTPVFITCCVYVYMIKSSSDKIRDNGASANCFVQLNPGKSIIYNLAKTLSLFISYVSFVILTFRCFLSSVFLLSV